MSSEFQNIPLEKIKRNPNELRPVQKENEEYQGLLSSVKAKGVLVPIVVRPIDGEDEFILVDGLQRYTASQDAGLPTVPARIIVGMSEIESQEAQLIANANRVKTRPAAFGKQLQRICVLDPTRTVRQLADGLGCSVSWIQQRMNLKNLSPASERLVDEGAIVVTNGVALCTLPIEEQDDWLERAQTESPAVFRAAVDERVKELKKAAREGRAPKAANEFMAVPHMRKKVEIQDYINNPGRVSEIIGDATAPEEAAVRTLNWMMHMDEVSIAKQKADWDARQAAKEEEKKKRAAERAEKRSAEAAKAAEDAKAAVTTS